MSLLPEIGGGYLVNQGMLLKVDDVSFDVVEIEGGRRPRKKYNYEAFQPKEFPKIDSQKQKRKLRSQSHENASTGSEEDHQKEEQSKKRKEVSRSKSMAAAPDRPNELSEESRSVFTKYAGVARAQRKHRSDQSNNSLRDHTKSRSSDSEATQHVRFDDQTLESYPEEAAKELQMSQRRARPVPGYLKATRSSGNKVKDEMDVIRPSKASDKVDDVNVNMNELSDSEVVQNRASPGRYKVVANGRSHLERLREERHRARLWRETSSDPGKTEKSIQNDHVIKGRTSQNKRRYPNVNRHDERPKGADRARRMQSLTSKKDAHESETTNRSVYSAPSKEQPKPEGPMPKVNTLVMKSPQGEKESPKPAPNVKEPVVENKTKEKPKHVTPEPVFVKKSPVLEEKSKPPTKNGPKSKDSTSVPTEEKKTVIKLPPDDHGPANVPMETDSPAQASPTKSADFKYHATERAPAGEKGKSVDFTKEPTKDLTKDKVSPAQLRLHSEKSMKTDKSIPRGHVSRDISPSKSPGRGRDTSPSKSPGRGRDTSPSKSPGRGRDISPSKSPRRESLGRFLRRFEKSKTMTERTESSERSDPSKKKREVTIMDPRDIQKQLDLEGEEGFPEEYEIGYERRHKTFEEMTDEEKIEYFKQELKLRPEQIRELTFHPRVTEPKQIHRAYTGMDTVNWSQKSARLRSARRSKSRNASVYRKVSVVPPSQRKSHMLSKLQGVVYRHINKVYGTSTKNMREKQFFERLADLQLKEYQKRYEMLAENEQRQLEMKYKQREQLRSLRKKFEDDAWRRFMTQYVTSKVIESEFRDRSEYGLPNSLAKPSVSRNKRHIYTMTPKSRYRSNRKKYANMFNFKAGPEVKPGGKPLKFEGFDAIYIDSEDDQGIPMKRRQDVQALMEEAMDLLQTHDDDIDIEDSPRRSIRKQSEPAVRRYDSRRFDRPRHSMSRFKPYSDSRSNKTISERRSFKAYTEGQSIRGFQRSRPTLKPKPKTMKELISKRNPAPGNRYKASEFKTMKQNLLKDSEIMNRRQHQKDSKSAKDKPDEEKAISVEKPESDKSSVLKANGHHDPPPDISPMKPPEVLKKTEIKTETTTWPTKTGNVHLDDPETQVGIDSEKEKVVNEQTQQSAVTEKDKPVSSTVTTTKTVTTTTTRKTVVSPDKKASDSESQSESVSIKQERRGSITSQRRGSISSQRRGSLSNIEPINQRKTVNVSRTPSMATLRESEARLPITKTIQRNPSRASIFSVSQRQRPGLSQPTRAPSRVSVKDHDKQNTITSGTENDSRLSSVVPNEKRIPGEERVIENPSKEGIISVVDANKAGKDHKVNGNVANGNGGSPVTVSLGANDGRISPVVSMSTSTNEVDRPPANRRSSITSNKLNADPQRVHRKKSPTPSIRSRTVNEQSPSRPIRRESKHQIENHASNEDKPNMNSSTDVKRSEHMSEVVTEVVERKRNDLSPFRSDATSQSRKPTTENHSSNQAKPSQGRVSRAGYKNDRRQSIISQVKDANLPNGHSDTKMKREDYEKHGSERSRTRTPRRSRSRDKKGRKSSTSRGRERKRSTSRDKKRGKGKTQGKTRFPEIDQRPNSIARTSPPSQKAKTHVSRSEKVDETVTERELSPKGGADQWRDLVQKYMRQPSPKIGKPENRALLDASFDTDDDGEDIFARAQKRYALSISDGDSDA